MIRIVKGTFGWFDGRKIVPKTPADPPFAVDAGLEDRLVAEGVAEYADDYRADPAPEPAPAGPEERAEPATDLSDMTRAELAEVAESYGIAVGRRTKAQLVAAIEEAERAPSLSAAEVE